MTTLELPAASLDGVVAFYSLTHIPREELPALLARIHGWLRPGGVLVATMGAQDAPDDVEDDWLGVPMFFSHHGAKRNRALVRAAGFEIEEAAVQEEPGDRHGALFLWVVARLPKASIDA
jgi:SAM-dependent methyltransferase